MTALTKLLVGLMIADNMYLLVNRVVTSSVDSDGELTGLFTGGVQLFFCLCSQHPVVFFF